MSKQKNGDGTVKSSERRSKRGEWTPEEMANAKPVPMPEVNQEDLKETSTPNKKDDT